MKQLLTILFCLLVFKASAPVITGSSITAKPIPTAGGSCPDPSGSPSYDGSMDGYGFSMNQDSTNFRAERWTPPANTNVCTVGVYLITASGDTSGKTITCSIRSASAGAYTVVLGSKTTTGFNNGSGALVKFTFDTPIALTASTAYIIAIDQGATDASNYLQIGYNNTTGLGAGATHGNIADWFPNNDGEHITVKLWAY